jgi:hypothetical protein
MREVLFSALLLYISFRMHLFSIRDLYFLIFHTAYFSSFRQYKFSRYLVIWK